LQSCRVEERGQWAGAVTQCGSGSDPDISQNFFLIGTKWYR
jgi:hypothetical protein